MCLEDSNNPDKDEFYKQIVQDGVEVTEEKEIKMEQGEEEYKMSIENWEFLGETIEEYRQNSDCIWGPFTNKQISEHKDLKDGYIMPHFIRTTVREDGSIKKREVTDASSKKLGGRSFNEYIYESEKILRYVMIYTIIAMIEATGIKWMIMADAVNAFKRIPIATRFIKYFGVKIGSVYFYWTCLTYGGGSSCRIYGWFAAYVVWILVYYNNELFIIKGTVVLRNYLDDFFAGHSSYIRAWQQYFTILIWFSLLGIPTQIKKMCTPTQIMKFIGYIINLYDKILEIPLDKIVKVKKIGLIIIEHRKQNKKIKVRILQSFCGIVRYMTPIFYYVIPFLRNIERRIGTKDPSEEVSVSKEIERDIRLIIETIMSSKRNKISFAWLLYDKAKGDIITETDASGKIGLGGLEKRKNGIFFKVLYKDIPDWDINNDPDIVWKELCAVWIMHRLQKKAWTGKAVHLKVDNKAVEHIMIKKKACFRRKDLQILVRGICKHSMVKDYYHWYSWISTKANKYSDGLSRNRTQVMKELKHLKLQDRSEKAKILAIEAYKEYKKIRTEMKTKSDIEKRCHCNKDNSCDNQHLYEKWRQIEKNR